MFFKKEKQKELEIEWEDENLIDEDFPEDLEIVKKTRFTKRRVVGTLLSMLLTVGSFLGYITFLAPKNPVRFQQEHIAFITEYTKKSYVKFDKTIHKTLEDDRMKYLQMMTISNQKDVLPEVVKSASISNLNITNISAGENDIYIAYVTFDHHVEVKQELVTHNINKTMQIKLSYIMASNDLFYAVKPTTLLFTSSVVEVPKDTVDSIKRQETVEFVEARGTALGSAELAALKEQMIVFFDTYSTDIKRAAALTAIPDGEDFPFYFHGFFATEKLIVEGKSTEDETILFVKVPYQGNDGTFEYAKTFVITLHDKTIKKIKEL